VIVGEPTKGLEHVTDDDLKATYRRLY